MDRSNAMAGVAAGAGAGEGGTVLVGVRGYDSGHHEKEGGSTATSRTSNGRPIEVTFSNEAPPALSHFSAHGSDLPPAAHGDLLLAPKVIAADDGLLLLRVPVNPVPGGKSLFRQDDYFVYHHHQPARLDLLPRPCQQYCLRDDDFAIVSICGDKQQYVVAALEMINLPSQFALHRYKSSSSGGGGDGDEIAGNWTCEEVFVEEAVRDRVCPIPDSAERPLYHITTKTIALGGAKGTVGWVDLWRGILLCDLLDEMSPPKLRDMPLPWPAKGNWTRYLSDSESLYRDITVSQHKDFIKYVEMEITMPRVVTKTIILSSGDRAMPAVDPPDSFLEWVRRSREPQPQPTTRQRSSIRRPGQWRLTTWTMPIPVTSWEEWRPDCTANLHDFHVVDNPAHHGLLNKLMLSTGDDEEAKGSSLSLGCLAMSYPALSIDDDDVVYLLCNSANRDCDMGGVMIALDVRKKEIRGAAKLDGKKNTLFSMRCYLATAISKHPTTTADTRSGQAKE